MTVNTVDGQPRPARVSAAQSCPVAPERGSSRPRSPGRSVTLVISSLGAGGAERVLSMMANHWAEREWPVTLITLDRASSDFYRLHPAVERVGLDASGVSRNAWHALWNNRKRVMLLHRAIHASRPEVVVAFTVPTTVITLLAARPNRTPVIVSERVDPTRSPLSRIWVRSRRITYPWASAVVVQTPEVRRWAEGFVRPDAIHVIPNPVAIPTAVPRRSESDTSTGPPLVDDGTHHIVAIGRLDVQKGFDLLLRAFAECCALRPQWHLTILGEGEERARLEALAKQLGAASRVHMPGRVADPTTVLRDADLFVLSSRYEGFPNALLEAMAIGLPVIATDCPSGPARIVTNDVDGVLVPNDDSAALAAAMASLMDDEPRRQRLGEHAADVTKRFAVERVMTTWETLIEDVLAKQGARVGRAHT